MLSTVRSRKLERKLRGTTAFFARAPAAADGGLGAYLAGERRNPEARPFRLGAGDGVRPFDPP